MSTKSQNILNPASCWNRAKPDEPVFGLRANDPLAPQMVREWAKRYAEMKQANRGGITAEQAHKVAFAHAIAESMRKYRLAEDDDSF